MAFQENDLVVKTNNGFVEIIIYGNGSTNDRSIANPPIGSVWAQKQNVTNPQLIQFYLVDKTMIAGANFAAIKDLNGDPFGADIDSALSAILTLIAPTSGGGGSGGATEAKQDDQIAEAVLQTNIQNATLIALPSIRTSGLATVAATEQMAANQTNGAQVSKDYQLAVSMGLIANTTAIQKVGYNPDVDIITAPSFQLVAAGGGAYTGFVAADNSVQVVSSNAGDVGTIYVQYLADANSTDYQEGQISVTGTTPSNSAFKAYRIHTAYYKPTNGNPHNLGTITIRQVGAPTNIFALILPYTNQTNTGVYTVPAGKEVEILAISCTIGNATGGASSFVKTGILHKSTTETSFRARRPALISFGMQYTDPPTVVLRLPEKTDIMFVVTSANTNNTEVTFGATIIQKPNTP